jgi:hypothetical protein
MTDCSLSDDRQKDRQTDRQIDGQTYIHTYRRTYIQTDRQTNDQPGACSISKYSSPTSLYFESAISLTFPYIQTMVRVKSTPVHNRGSRSPPIQPLLPPPAVAILLLPVALPPMEPPPAIAILPVAFGPPTRATAAAIVMMGLFESTTVTRLGKVARRTREEEVQEIVPELTKFNDDNEGYASEAQLLVNVSLEDILLTTITFDDFCCSIATDDKLVWMSHGVYICTDFRMEFLNYDCVLELGSNQNVINRHGAQLRVYAGTEAAPAATKAVCDFAVRLLATTTAGNAYIASEYVSLSRFLQGTRDTLRELTLVDMILDVDHLQTLHTTGPLHIILDSCELSSDHGCPDAFIACLRRGPTELVECLTIPSEIVADALDYPSRVTRLVLTDTSIENDLGEDDNNALGLQDDHAQHHIFGSLAHNRSLEKVVLYNCSISDENWTILCQSLTAHPTLTSIDLRLTNPWRALDGWEFTVEDKAVRTRLLADMMRVNRMLQIIRLSDNEIDNDICNQSILPYLDVNINTNALRQHLLAGHTD